MEVPHINIDEFDYPLPSERIAKYPLENRDQSKLLVYKNNQIQESSFVHISNFLPTDALMVFNNTKVIRARLHFNKSTGARIEVFCLEPHLPPTAEQAFQARNQVEWQCLVGNQKKWKEGCISREIVINGMPVEVTAQMAGKLADGMIVRFIWSGNDTFASVMEAMGETPIPPYLERQAEAIDTERYQTVYSKYNGSVAAPTAGLHFSPTVLENVSQKGFKTIELTLHVGAGTFKPVKSKTIGEHEMHTEHFRVPIETLQTLINHPGPIIAVGTTTVRTLESLYLAGVKLQQGVPFHHISQWDGFRYRSNLSYKESLQTLTNYLKKGQLTAFEASTSIIIVPGFEFSVINGLITNFHQPRSTLLLLIAALVGEDWQRIYRFALDNQFRFLSYGDSSLLMAP